MCDRRKITDADAKAIFLVTTCHYRLLLHAPGVEQDLEKMIFIFDTGPAGEILSEETLLEIKSPIDRGKTILLSCLNKERREFVQRIAQKIGWVSAVFTDVPSGTKH